MIDSLWTLLRSVKLTIFLFLLLASGAVLGTLIPQNLSMEDYVHHYGPFAARFLHVLGITDVYHSLWFVGMIVLLMLNLTSCSLYRLPAVWKVLWTKPRPLTDTLWKNLPVHRIIRLEEGGEKALEVLRDVLRGALWQVRLEQTGEERHLIAQKGRLGPMGYQVTHMGVILVMMGALVGSLIGFQGFVRIEEGKVALQVEDRRKGGWRELGFGVRCDAFKVDTYPDGTPKEFRSDLTFLQDGRAVQKGILRVNHPLKFGGYVFYQSSYGYTGTVTLEAQKGAQGERRRLQLDLAETLSLDEDGSLRIRLMEYQPDFRGQGPALLLAILRRGEHPVGGWVLIGGPPVRIQEWTMRFISVHQRAWTGIQVKKDPGVWIVWLGCTLILMGCLLAFFVPHRKVWVRMRPQGEGAFFHLGASSRRGVQGLEKAVEGILQRWKARTDWASLEVMRSDDG